MQNRPDRVQPKLHREAFTGPIETSFPVTRATQQMRNLAKRIIDDETPKNKALAVKTLEAFPVTDRIRPHLVPLMGVGGFRALLSRALVLASVEVAWLREVRVNGAGVLERAEPLHASRGPAALLEGRIALLAQLLGLLVSFIGASLTARLMGEIWPRLSLKDIDFGDGATK